jgi:hypothetical protein
VSGRAAAAASSIASRSRSSRSTTSSATPASISSSRRDPTWPTAIRSRHSLKASFHQYEARSRSRFNRVRHRVPAFDRAHDRNLRSSSRTLVLCRAWCFGDRSVPGPDLRAWASAEQLVLGLAVGVGKLDRRVLPRISCPIAPPGRAASWPMAASRRMAALKRGTATVVVPRSQSNDIAATGSAPRWPPGRRLMR